MTLGKFDRIRQLGGLYLAWRKNHGYKPLRAELLLTSRCNSRCRICNVWKLVRHRSSLAQDELSTEQWFSILSDLHKLGCEGIFISGGEPTIRTDLIEIIKFAKSKRLNVDLVTNGLLIEETLAIKLVNSGLDRISISIDSPTPEIHDWLRGIEGSWNQAVKAVGYVNMVREQALTHTPKINISYIVSNKSWSYIKRMLELKSELKYDTINFQPIISKVREAQEILLTEEDISKISQNLGDIRKTIRCVDLPPKTIAPLQLICMSKSDSAKGDYTAMLNKKCLCFAPWLMTTIDPFGNVYPCCFACTFQNLSDDLNGSFWGNGDLCMGNLKETTFSDIWYGKNYDNLRRIFKNPPRYKMCNWCYYKAPSSRDMLLTGLFKDKRLLLDISRSRHAIMKSADHEEQ